MTHNIDAVMGYGSCFISAINKPILIKHSKFNPPRLLSNTHDILCMNILENIFHIPYLGKAGVYGLVNLFGSDLVELMEVEISMYESKSKYAV